MVEPVRAKEYANPTTCLRSSDWGRPLATLNWIIKDGDDQRWLLPDGLVLIVGSDMSVALDHVGSPAVNTTARVVEPDIPVRAQLVLEDRR